MSGGPALVCPGCGSRDVDVRRGLLCGTCAEPVQVRPRCYDCLSEDVTVKVIGPYGFEHWFCAADWAAEQELHEKVMTLLGDAAAELGKEGA